MHRLKITIVSSAPNILGSSGSASRWYTQQIRCRGAHSTHPSFHDTAFFLSYNLGMFTGVCTCEHFDYSGMEGVRTENHGFFRKVISRIIHYGKAGNKILIVCDRITCDCFQVKWPLLVLDKFRA